VAHIKITKMKKIKVFNQSADEDVTELQHEFNITQHYKQHKLIYELSYSNNPVWENHCKGKVILQVVDVGNFLEFNFNENIDFKELGYDEAYYIFIILKYIQKSKNSHKIKFK